MPTASLRRKLILSLASSLAALVLVTGGVGIQRKLETFRSPGIVLRGVADRVMVAGVDPAVHDGLERGDRLLLIGGDTVRKVRDALDALRGQPEAEVVAQRGDEIVTVEWVRPRLAIDWSYVAQALIGALYLLIGLYTVLREQTRQSFLFYLWCAVSAAFFLLVATPQDQLLADDTGKALFVVEQLARILLPPLTLHFFLLFPAELGQAPRWRRLIPFLYLPAAFLASLHWDLIANDGRTLLGTPSAAELGEVIARLDRIELFLFVAFAVAAGLLLLYRLLVGERREARRQLLWIALGMAGGYLPFLALYLIPWSFGLDASLLVEIAVVLPLAIVPLTFAYAILRWRLWDISVIARDVATYGLTMLFGLVGFSLLRMLVEIGVPASSGFVRDLLSVAAVIVVGGLLVPARQGIGATLERVQYRTRFGKRRNLAQLGKELLHERDLERLSTQLLLHVEEALALDRSNLLLSEEEQLRPLRRAEGSTIRLPLDLFGDEFWQEDHRELQGATLPGAGGFSARELYVAGYRYAFPLTVRGRKVGVLLCGLRYGEMPFSSDDLALVRQLLDQASLAIENAHLLDRLQNQLEEVRQLKQYTESIIEATPAGIAVLDGDGRILSANLAFAALAGFDPDALRRKGLLEVMPLERIPRPEDGVIELQLEDERGQRRSLQASVAPFSSTRGGSQAVLVVNDITDRVAMEHKLEEKERLAALGIMAAGIAHEVNTPITGISSYAQMLLDSTPADDPRYPLLRKVERQTFRASRIVNSLLSLARNQAIDAQPVDVAELVRECLELLRDRVEGHRIRVELADGQPAIVTGADGELQQVFTNLFQNAIEAMHDGGMLRVGITAGDPWIEVTVDDSGPGISPALRERVFEPFYSTKQRIGGSGLGLSISHEIIRRHGGELELVDRPDGPGCRFVVRLRAARRSG